MTSEKNNFQRLGDELETIADVIDHLPLAGLDDGAAGIMQAAGSVATLAGNVQAGGLEEVLPTIAAEATDIAEGFIPFAEYAGLASNLTTGKDPGEHIYRMFRGGKYHEQSDKVDDTAPPSSTSSLEEKNIGQPKMPYLAAATGITATTVLNPFQQNGENIMATTPQNSINSWQGLLNFLGNASDHVDTAGTAMAFVTGNKQLGDNIVDIEGYADVGINVKDIASDFMSGKKWNDIAKDRLPQLLGSGADVVGTNFMQDFLDKNEMTKNLPAGVKTALASAAGEIFQNVTEKALTAGIQLLSGSKDSPQVTQNGERTFQQLEQSAELTLQQQQAYGQQQEARGA